MSKKTAVIDALATVGERPDEIAESLVRFREAASVLSSNHPRLIDEYPDQWVAVCNSDVVAQSDNIDSLLSKVDAKGIDRADVIVRMIERNLRTFIL